MVDHGSFYNVIPESKKPNPTLRYSIPKDPQDLKKAICSQIEFYFGYVPFYLLDFFFA